MFPTFRAAIGNAAQIIVDETSAAYFAALNAAGCGMNANNQQAIINFIAGCVADGIWNDMKTVVPLAGPSCRAGILVPLKGVAPFSVNFVDADYVVNTGLKGNGSNKYLNTNESPNSIGTQNDAHMACYTTSALVPSYYMGTASSYIYSQSSNFFSLGMNGNARTISASYATPSFLGVKRSSSGGIDVCVNSTESNFSDTSSAPNTSNIHIFRNSAVSGSGYTSSRIAFYSLGTSLNLGKLRTRIADYVSALTV